MVACVLLSAGLSRRFGSPKALAKFNTLCVIEHMQKVLIESSLGEIVVVLGAYFKEIKPRLIKHQKIKFVFNKNYEQGQTSSFKAGVAQISPKALGIMLLPVDYPAVRAQTIDQLSAQFLKMNPKILIPTHGGKRGHPPIFSGTLKDEILSLPDGVGLNRFEHQHESQVLLVPVDDSGVLKSFNTPEEFEDLKANVP